WAMPTPLPPVDAALYCGDASRACRSSTGTDSCGRCSTTRGWGGLCRSKGWGIWNRCFMVGYPEGVASMSKTSGASGTSFSFGKNWQNFMESISQDRIDLAKRSLTEYLGVPDLASRTFLDIGCGSGLFSYAAHSLSASRVVSFDADPYSVACCQHLR